MSLSVSVTEVRNALRCPRLFVLGRRTGRAQGHPAGASLLGATFHRVVDELSRRVAAIEGHMLGTTESQVRGAVAHVAMSLLLVELERRPWLTSMPAEVDDVAEALRQLAAYVARAVAAGPGNPSELLRGFFVHSEVELDATVEGIRVRGRADAVFRRGAELDVIEFKLTAESNAPLDRAQVALYQRLLRERRGIEAEAVVLRFAPQLQETRLGVDAADELVQRVVEPLLAAMPGWLDAREIAPATERTDLCPACPLRDACAAEYPAQLPPRDTPPATARRPDAETGVVTSGSAAEAPAGDAASEGDLAVCQDAVATAFRDLGVPAKVTGGHVGPRLILLEIAAKATVRDIDKARDAIIHHLQTRASMAVQLEREGGVRRIVAERREPRPVSLDALLRRDAVWLGEEAGRFVLGEKIGGGVLHGDLGDPSSCHLLVGGQSGSGKSVLLRALTASLVQLHPPSAIQLSIVDPKRVTFGGQRAALAAHLARPLCFDAEGALGILAELVDEMEERYRLLEQAGVDSLSELPAEARLPRQVLIVDEFADLLASSSLARELEHHLKRLGSKSRAAGIHLILATQRPDAKTMSMALRANLPGRVALRVADRHNAQIILDQPGAEDLLGKGDLLANLGAGVVRAQAPMI